MDPHERANRCWMRCAGLVARRREIRASLTAQFALLPVLLVVGLLAGVGSASAATTWYADTTLHGAGGTTCSNGSPCTVAYVLAHVACGDSINFKDGTYKGNDDMFVFASINCTAGAQIVAQAVNDGQVLFDGEGARAPCKWNGATYWTIQGINCARSDTSANVITIRNSDHFTLKRVVGYEAPTAALVAIVLDSSNTLVEDCAFFGLGSAAFLDYGTNAGNVYRRIWMRNEGDSSDYGVANQYNYTDANWANPALIENVISVIGPNRGGQLGYGTNTLRHNAVSPYMRFYGMIDYAQDPSVTFSEGDAGIVNDGGYSGVIMQDWLVHHNGTNHKPLALNSGGSEAPVQTQDLIRVTTIRGSSSSSYGSYSQTNVVEATTVGGTGFDYVGSSNTAKLCFEYQNGAYSSTPLWPWRMDDRIKAAIANNSGSPSLAGSAGTGYGANTVTSEIASLFGAIPNSCNRTSRRRRLPQASRSSRGLHKFK